MKKICFLLFVVIFLTSCKSKIKMILPTPAGIYVVSEREKQKPLGYTPIMETPIVDKQYSQVLIVYYDKEISTKKLLKAIEKQKWCIGTKILVRWQFRSPKKNRWIQWQIISVK